jgi:hypothetical protein
MPDAQANVFAWGGLGRAYLDELEAHRFAWNAGAQVDYETRRWYSSLPQVLMKKLTLWKPATMPT